MLDIFISEISVIYYPTHEEIATGLYYVQDLPVMRVINSKLQLGGLMRGLKR